MKNTSTQLLERTIRINSNPIFRNYDAFLTTDHNLIIKEVNEATLNSLGYNSKQLIGTSIEGIIKENALEVYMTFLNSSLDFQNSGDNDLMVNLFSNSGKTIRVNLFVTTLPESNNDHHIWLFKCQKKEKNSSLLQFLSKYSAA